MSNSPHHSYQFVEGKSLEGLTPTSRKHWLEILRLARYYKINLNEQNFEGLSRRRSERRKHSSDFLIVYPEQYMGDTPYVSIYPYSLVKGICRALSHDLGAIVAGLKPSYIGLHFEDSRILCTSSKQYDQLCSDLRFCTHILNACQAFRTTGIRGYPDNHAELVKPIQIGDLVRLTPKAATLLGNHPMLPQVSARVIGVNHAPNGLPECDVLSVEWSETIGLVSLPTRFVRTKLTKVQQVRGIQ